MYREGGRKAGSKADYFATSNRTEEWTMGGLAR
jgi:hypothetical protein